MTNDQSCRTRERGMDMVDVVDVVDTVDMGRLVRACFQWWAD